MKKTVLFLVLFGALCIQVYGEPTPTVSWLMNEPVSMWDWGLMRLENSLRAERSLSNFSVRVDYQWDANIIRILVNDTLEPENDWGREKIVDYGKQVANSIRESLYVNTQTGKPYGSGESFLEINFFHMGFERHSRPDNMGKELDAITEIRVHIMFYENDEQVTMS